MLKNNKLKVVRTGRGLSTVPLKISLRCYKGDLLTSKKGFVMESPLTGNQYIVSKIEVVGDDSFVARSDKYLLREGKTK